MGAIKKGAVCVVIAGRESGSPCVVNATPENLIVEITTNTGEKRKINARHLEPTGETAKTNAEIEKVLGVELGKEKPKTKKDKEKKAKPKRKVKPRESVKRKATGTKEKAKNGKEKK